MVGPPSLSSTVSHIYPYYTLYHIVLYSSIYLALLVDGEQLENQDCLLTLFLVLGTN